MARCPPLIGMHTENTTWHGFLMRTAAGRLHLAERGALKVVPVLQGAHQMIDKGDRLPIPVVSGFQKQVHRFFGYGVGAGVIVDRNWHDAGRFIVFGKT